MAHFATHHSIRHVTLVALPVVFAVLVRPTMAHPISQVDKDGFRSNGHIPDEGEAPDMLEAVLEHEGPEWLGKISPDSFMRAVSIIMDKLLEGDDLCQDEAVIWHAIRTQILAAENGEYCMDFEAPSEEAGVCCFILAHGRRYRYCTYHSLLDVEPPQDCLPACLPLEASEDDDFDTELEDVVDGLPEPSPAKSEIDDEDTLSEIFARFYRNHGRNRGRGGIEIRCRFSLTYLQMFAKKQSLLIFALHLQVP